jgi:hypothetical protein
LDLLTRVLRRFSPNHPVATPREAVPIPSIASSPQSVAPGQMRILTLENRVVFLPATPRFRQIFHRHGASFAPDAVIVFAASFCGFATSLSWSHTPPKFPNPPPTPTNQTTSRHQPHPRKPPFPLPPMPSSNQRRKPCHVPPRHPKNK